MQTIRKEFFCDIAIIGGGVGGCAAAIAAARRGQHVMMFEKGVSLGGLATNGYVPQIAGGIEGICLEFAERLDAAGMLRKRDPSKNYYRNPSFEPEWGKFILENMVTAAGARVIYDATAYDVEMEGPEKIKKVFLHTKGGTCSVEADIFIDATGDADLAAMAGVPYEVGGKDYAGLNMSTTLGTRWSGADLITYQKAEDEYQAKQKAEGVQYPTPLVWALEEEAIQRGEVIRHICNKRTGFFRVIIPNTPMDNADFVTFSFHSYFCHNTDVEDITRQVLEQHQLIQGFEKFLKKYVPGFANIRLVGTGSLPGVRDSRRIFGEYMLKAADIICGTKFKDGIARFPENMDTHHPTSQFVDRHCHDHLRPNELKGSAIVIEGHKCRADMHPFGEPEGVAAYPDPRDYCESPYGCLLPRRVDNLLAVGRCCSAEFHANGAMRIIGPAMETGQAAGVAADIALKRGVRPRDISGVEMRKIMIEEEGIPLDEPCDGFWAEQRAKKGTPKFVGGPVGDRIEIVPDKK